MSVCREVSILHANYHGSLLWPKQLQGGFYQPVGKYTFFLGIDFPLTANNHLPTGWEVDIFTHNQWLQVSSRPVSSDVWLIVTLIHLTIHCHASKMKDLNTEVFLHTHRYRPLLVIKKQWKFKLIRFDLTFQTWRLHSSFILSMVLGHMMKLNLENDVLSIGRWVIQRPVWSVCSTATRIQISVHRSHPLTGTRWTQTC